MSRLLEEIAEAFAEVRALRVLVPGALMLALILVLSGISMQASARALDAKPRPIATAPLTAPLDGLYIDQAMPARYCVIQTGEFGWFGRQTFLHCAAGYNNAGQNFVVAGVQLGQEYLLYRLQAEGGYLAPVVISSVTVSSATLTAIVVRFGSPGAQTPAYVLSRGGAQ